MLRSISNAPPQLGVAEYVWVDGNGFHSKTRVIKVFQDGQGYPVPVLDNWTTHESNELATLSPAFFLPDPLRPVPSYVVLCEVRDSQDRAISTRASLRHLVKETVKGRLLSDWGFKQPFSPFSPSSIAKEMKVAESLLFASVDAGLMLHSAHLDPHRRIWDFKIGRRGIEDPKQGQDYPILVCDHLMIARYFLSRCLDNEDVDQEATQGRKGAVYVSTAETREDSQALHRAAQRIREAKPTGWMDILVREDLGCIKCRGLPSSFDPYSVVSSLLNVLVFPQEGLRG